MFVSNWPLYLTLLKTNMSPKKGLFPLGNTPSNHWFSGDMIVFRGVNPWVQIFRCRKQKHTNTNVNNTKKAIKHHSKQYNITSASETIPCRFTLQIARTRSVCYNLSLIISVHQVHPQNLGKNIQRPKKTKPSNMQYFHKKQIWQHKKQVMSPPVLLVVVEVQWMYHLRYPYCLESHPGTKAKRHDAQGKKDVPDVRFTI